MDGLGPGDFSSRKNGRNIQIAVFGCSRTDANRFVSQTHMHGVRIGSGMHRDSFDAHFAAGALNTKRDFATVGNQDFVEHAVDTPTYSIMTSGSSYSTGWPSVARICVTLPDFGARIGLKVFIASISIRVWPSVTLDPAEMNGAAPGSGAK